jgi:hypothetical protein
MSEFACFSFFDSTIHERSIAARHLPVMVAPSCFVIFLSARDLEQLNTVRASNRVSYERLYGTKGFGYTDSVVPLRVNEQYKFSPWSQQSRIEEEDTLCA